MNSSANQRLLQILPSECVATGDQERFLASFDNLKFSALPDAVIKPRDEQDVQVVLVLANELRIPVTCRGSGSGAVGSCVPLKGGWVLDFSGWKQCHIDSQTGIAYVQPGVITADLHAAAEAEGWFYPPDPSSLKYCSIGGNIACNAGGMRAAKYGVTRDYVMGLEGFLPTGKWVRWGGDVRKFVSGYNLRDLWVGDEGTLGIITGAVLRLIPKPTTRWTAAATFASDAAALEAALSLVESRIRPCILEFIDEQTIETLLAWLATSGNKLTDSEALTGFIGTLGGSAMLLLELDGSAASVAEERAAVEKWLTEANAKGSYSAQNPQEADALRNIRRQCSPAMYTLGNTKLNEDVCVPLAAMPELIEYTLEIREKTGMPTPTYGHAADGNLHVHIMYNRNEEGSAAKADEAICLIMQKVVELGGCITGEHGVGLAKTPFFRMQHSEEEIAAMRAVKQALDPNNILNPGKIFDPFAVWEHPLVEHKMPWDH